MIIYSTKEIKEQRRAKESNKSKSYSRVQFQDWYYLNLIVLFISQFYAWRDQIVSAF